MQKSQRYSSRVRRFVDTTPGRQPFAILFAKDLFDILIDETTTTWFDEYNNDHEKREFFSLHEMCMLLLCGLARTAEDFNTASCLQLGTVDHVAKNEYERATMNMADGIKEVKKMIRKN